MDEPKAPIPVLPVAAAEPQQLQYEDTSRRNPNVPAIASVICALLPLTALVVWQANHWSGKVEIAPLMRIVLAGCAPLAIVLGQIALWLSRDPLTTVKGRRLAWLGIVLGILGIAVLVALPWIEQMIVAQRRGPAGTSRVVVGSGQQFVPPPPRTLPDACSRQMQRIWQALLLYAVAHQGHYPDSLDDLLLERDRYEDVAFWCPTAKGFSTSRPDLLPQK